MEHSAMRDWLLVWENRVMQGIVVTAKGIWRACLCVVELMIPRFDINLYILG